MSAYQRLRPSDLLPTEEELAAQRKAASAPGTDQAIGGGIGGVAGAGLGALLSIPSFGSLAPVLIPAGTGVGAALGSAIGGAVGNSEADKADATLNAADLERQKKLAREQMRQRALAELEAAG